VIALPSFMKENNNFKIGKIIYEVLGDKDAEI
jgi:hypothetical protein